MWSVDDGGPLLLVGGGSGVVPLACMLRHRAARRSTVPATLVYSARTTADLIFGDELRALRARRDGFHFMPTLTRETTPPPGVRVGRIDAALLADALERLSGPPKTVFVCGANAFVETAADALLGLGLPPATIRTERYGGT
jgi:ferredoxin-NADP reductase